MEKSKESFEEWVLSLPESRREQWGEHTVVNLRFYDGSQCMVMFCEDGRRLDIRYNAEDGESMAKDFAKTLRFMRISVNLDW